MSSLQQIENDVAALSPTDLKRFGEWFDDHRGQLLDARLKQDAVSGKLNFLLDEAREANQGNRARVFP